MTYVAETGYLKAKTVAKLHSTELDIQRRSALISRKDKVRNNQTTATVWTCPKNGGGETTNKSTEMAAIREKETRWTQTYLGGGDQRNDGRKGANGRRLDRQKQMEEEDYIIATWAQGDGDTLYSLLNNNRYKLKM